MRLLALLLPCALVGQTFGCFDSPELPYGGDAELHRGEQITFTPILDPTRISEILKLPSKKLGGFGPSYPVQQIAVFGALKTQTESLIESDTADLFLEVRKGSGRTSFYQLVAPKTYWASDGAFPFDGGIAELRIVPATSDNSVPLVVLQTKSRTGGANTMGEIASRHLLDFRQGEPRSLVALDCTSIGGGGACGAHDMFFDQRHSLACSWAPRRDDFLCTQETTNRWAWGSVTWKEAFYLIHGDAAPPPGVPLNAPRSPQQWAAGLTPNRPKSIVLPGYGDTHLLASLGNRIKLLASRGDTRSLIPRFYLYTPDDTLRIEPRLFAEDQVEQWIEPLGEDAPGVLTGAPMSFAVKPLLPSPEGLHFFQVTLTQDKHHSLFWVGIDCRRGQCVADVLWVATDALEYDHCRVAHIPDSAVYANWTGGGVALAELDIEPRRNLDYIEGLGYYPKFPEQPELLCPYEADLRWSDGAWVIQRIPRPCDPATIRVRAITVSSQGELSASPAKMFDSGQQ